MSKWLRPRSGRQGRPRRGTLPRYLDGARGCDHGRVLRARVGDEDRAMVRSGETQDTLDHQDQDEDPGDHSHRDVTTTGISNTFKSMSLS